MQRDQTRVTIARAKYVFPRAVAHSVRVPRVSARGRQAGVEPSRWEAVTTFFVPGMVNSLSGAFLRRRGAVTTSSGPWGGTSAKKAARLQNCSRFQRANG